MTARTALDPHVLRAEITRRWHRSGLCPSHAELADVLGTPVEEVECALATLVELHGVVLDGDGRVRIAHPFQALPSPCWVAADNRGWWSPCAWCALGSMAMADEPSALHTTFGGEGERIVIRRRGDELDRTDWVLLVTRPARDWWNDVACTCALNLVLPSAEDAALWSARHGFDAGAVLSSAQAWTLARAWYGRALDTPWRRRTRSEAVAIFKDLGLTTPFWHLPPTWT